MTGDIVVVGNTTVVIEDDDNEEIAYSKSTPTDEQVNARPELGSPMEAFQIASKGPTLRIFTKKP